MTTSVTRGWRGWALALVAVLAGWVAVMAAVMVLTDAAPGAVVLWPAPGFVDRLPPGVAVVDGGGWWIAVRGTGPGLGPALWSAGAALVLPAGLPGCLPLPDGPGGGM